MLTDKPEKAVDLLTPRTKAVVNPISDIHNKVSKPSIVVFAEDIADNLNDVEEPDKKLNTKSEPERVDKITFMHLFKIQMETGSFQVTLHGHIKRL